MTIQENQSRPVNKLATPLYQQWEKFKKWTRFTVHSQMSTVVTLGHKAT